MFKIFWIIRFITIQLIFGRNLRIFGYIGTPNYLRGISRANIGNKVRIFPNARIEIGKKAKLIIENNVSIGPNVNITCFGNLIIKSGSTISANVFITDMDHDFSNHEISVMDASNKIDVTTIGNNCFIGANTVILAGSTLGDSTIVGANSTVRGHFADRLVIAGSPAKVIRKRQ